MDKPSIFINPKSGSIKISGDIDLIDGEGKVVRSLTDSKLCGCGLSKNKPFCDSSHGEYVKIVATQLRNARKLVKACNLFGATPVRAREIRENELKYRLEAGEALLGVKLESALDSTKKDKPSYLNIFGYLTDAMQCVDSVPIETMIHPRAEAEVVFKLSKELATQIDLSQVLDYVSHVAAGIEILDYRFGEVEVYAEDAIADNAGATAFSYSPWVLAQTLSLDVLTAHVFINGSLVESAPLSSIQGNPWMAIVELSKVLAATGVRIPAGSILFSGSATNGVHMIAGNTYGVEIDGLGSVEIKAS